MTIKISLDSPLGVNFNADFKDYLATHQTQGWPYIQGGQSEFTGNQIVLLGKIAVGSERDTKALILDGSNFVYYFNDHTLSGTLTTVTLAVLGESYVPATKSFKMDAAGKIIEITSSISISGLSISNGLRERGDFHNTTYALMGGSHKGGGNSNSALLEKFIWAEAHDVSGSLGNDSYIGTAFDDVIAGNAGDDRLDGGAGVDTAVFSHSSTSYNLSRQMDGSVTVSDKRSVAWSDGSDTLINVEFAKFSDKIFDLRELVRATDTTSNETSVNTNTNTITPTVTVSAPTGKVQNGGPSNDVLIGTDGSDELKGGAGDDNLIGGLGTNTLDGGLGFDYAKYGEQRIKFEVSRDGSTVNIRSRDNSISDRLDNIERVAFADGILAFDIDGNAGKAYRLYKAAFDRKPDQDGLSFWIKKLDAGQDMNWITSHYVRSDEFQKLYGSEGTVSDGRYIELLYTNTLGRNYEKAGYDYWLDRLTEKNTSREHLLSFFAESDENKFNTINQVSDGIWYS